MRPGGLSLIVLLVLTALLVRPGNLLAQQRKGAAADFKLSAAEQPAIQKGLQFLRTKAGPGQVGENALMALAMISSDVPASDPALAACLAKIKTRFPGSMYVPERGHGPDIYEAAVVAMVLSELDPVSHKSDIDAVGQFIIGRQNTNGSWDYAGRTQGDSSISQYALLGLWAVEDTGFKVPPTVWDQAAGFYMSAQNGAGSWNYHRVDNQVYPETLSMTAAGVGSLLLCQRQLTRYRRATDSPNPLLVPILGEDTGNFEHYKPAHAASALQDSINKGVAWMGRSFTLGTGEIVGRTPYYFLYGLERIGALTNKDSLGGVNWFEQGRRFIQASQKADGAWAGDYGEEVNTSYAILFMTRATAKKIRRIEIKRLGAGTLLGGRGLPKDLSSLTVAQGRVMVRPMNGAVEGMLAVLEDPRAENADSALAGLVGRYQRGGAAALRPFKDRFRKLLTDRDPGVRRVAAWSLGRTGDLDVIPLLINALRQDGEDDSVVAEARSSLQFLSRKIDGFGPPTPSTKEERQDAAQQWQTWYNSIRPLDQDADADAPAAPRVGLPTGNSR